MAFELINALTGWRYGYVQFSVLRNLWRASTPAGQLTYHATIGAAEAHLKGE